VEVLLHQALQGPSKPEQLPLEEAVVAHPVLLVHPRGHDHPVDPGVGVLRHPLVRRSDGQVVPEGSLPLQGLLLPAVLLQLVPELLHGCNTSRKQVAKGTAFFFRTPRSPKNSRPPPDLYSALTILFERTVRIPAIL
jgi:hypothetical protein